MNVIKKLKGISEGEQVETAKKDTRVQSKHPFFLRLTTSNEPLYKLIDYEVRGDSVRSVMEELPSDVTG